jgi:hypothetical protein
MKMILVGFGGALAAISTVGCISTGMASAGSKRTFELDAKVQYKIGIREYGVTDYTYWETTGGTRKQLWKKQVNEAYVKHWIAPSGRVWIVTAGLPGPGGMGRVWVADLGGSERESWPGGVPDPRMPGAAAMPMSSSYDLKKSNVAELRPGVEQLRLVWVSGDERRLTLVEDSKGVKQFGLITTHHPGQPDPRIETILSDRAYDLPKIESPIDHWQMRFVSVTKPGETKPAKWWRMSIQQTGDGTGPGKFINPRDEADCDYPTSVNPSTGHQHVLWFSLMGDHPSLEVLKPDGMTTLKKIDLMSAGRFRDAKEAIATWKPENVRVADQGWTPLLSVKRDQWGGARDRLDAWDDQKRRHFVNFDANDNVLYSVAEGLATRDPKEMSSPDVPVLGERKYTSPNGLFTLRIRERKWTGGQNSWSSTLLLAAPDRGKTFNLELYSNFAYDDPGIARVDDLGRVMKISKDGYHIEMFDAEGNGLGSLDPVQRGLCTAAEAKSQIDLSLVKITPTGPIGEKDFEGVTLKQPLSEKVTLTLKNGRSTNYFLSGAGGRYQLYWTSAGQ